MLAFDLVGCTDTQAGKQASFLALNNSWMACCVCLHGDPPMGAGLQHIHTPYSP